MSIPFRETSLVINLADFKKCEHPHISPVSLMREYQWVREVSVACTDNRPDHRSPVYKRAGNLPE